MSRWGLFGIFESATSVSARPMAWEEVFAGFYVPPLGLPVNYRNDPSGKGQAAVEAFYRECLGQGPAATEEQLAWIARFLEYFIHAPCWEANMRESGWEEGLADLAALRARSKSLVSGESIRRWIREAVDLGLDPF